MTPNPYGGDGDRGSMESIARFIWTHKVAVVFALMVFAPTSRWLGGLVNWRVVVPLAVGYLVVKAGERARDYLSDEESDYIWEK